MLTIGTTISRLNHLEYPAFEKMNQNGRMIKTTIIKHMISPKGPICSGMSLIISCMEFLLRIVCFSHLARFSAAAEFSAPKLSIKTKIERPLPTLKSLGCNIADSEFE